MKNKVLEQYLKELKKALCCPQPERAGLLSRGQSLLESFLEETPEADYEAVVTAFGPPESFAGEMLDAFDQEKLKQIRSRQTWLLRGAAILTMIIMIVSVFWLVGQDKFFPERNNSNPEMSTEPTVEPQDGPIFSWGKNMPASNEP